MTQKSDYEELVVRWKADADKLREKLIGDGNLGDIVLQKQITQLELDALMAEDPNLRHSALFTERLRMLADDGLSEMLRDAEDTAFRKATGWTF